jgi:Arc/MetJ-type ribon-helix-helix transcriptional regulator
VLLDKLKEEVSFEENKIPQMLRNNPENVRYTMLEELNDITGEFGSLRIKILKKAFWMFLENILPNCSKYGVAVFNNMNFWKWSKTVTSMKKRHRKHYNKHLENEKTIMGTVSQYKFSDEAIDSWVSNGKDFRSRSAILKKWVQSLVKTRNRIFKVLKELHDMKDKYDIIMTHSKDDHLKMAEASQRLVDIDQIKVLDLWGIKRKTEEKDLWDEDELTDYDQ